uniref:Uncharacterized protein n=1 Tax=Parascaris equorum TaxID=6256 RepID=A0A914RTZ6_PAREQ
MDTGQKFVLLVSHTKLLVLAIASVLPLVELRQDRVRGPWS